jgi:hypothetical protein
MVLRCNEGENGTAPAQHGPNDANEPLVPVPSRPLPEMIPAPEAQKAGPSAVPGAVPPPRSEPLRPKAAEGGALEAPRPDKGPAPADREAVPSQAKPPEKLPEKLPELPERLPISPPPPPKNATEPITTNALEPIIIDSGDGDSSLRFGEVWDKAGSGNRSELSELIPATLFTHGRITQASFADEIAPHDAVGQNPASPAQN